MDINQLLQGHVCTCGKTHTCPIQYVYIEPNAAARLSMICKDYEKLLIVADENTYGAAGERTLNALSGKSIRKVIFPGDRVLVPNEEAIEAVENVLGDTDLIVGIGSGVIQDLCKYVSFFRKVPYVIVATAPSMDGYASSGAAMITGGMKVTYSAGLPMAIVADTQVLAQAPMEMIQSGYGDIVGKFSSLNDWKLSHCVNGEYFCQYIYDLTFAQITQTLSLAEGLLQRREDSIRALTEALVIVGILISFAGSSRPASGSEHHLSHFFEITGILGGQEYFSHGIDVAYSTVVTAQIRQLLLESKFPTTGYRPDPVQYREKMDALYRSSAAGCMELQDKVGNYAKDRTQIYLDKEAQIRGILAEMPSADEIRRMLSLVQLDMAPFYQLYGEEKLRDAVLYAKDLKDRYTVLWMYYDFFGGQPCTVISA